MQLDADLANLESFPENQGIKQNHIVVHRKSKDFFHCTKIESRSCVSGSRSYYHCHDSCGHIVWLNEEDIRPVNEEEADAAMGWLYGSSIMNHLKPSFADEMSEPHNGDVYKDLDACITAPDRLLEDGRPKAIDLFSGAGGFTCGIAGAFNVVGHVEWDKTALMTYELNAPNFGFGCSERIGQDITKISDSEIQEFGQRHGQINLIVGGPPCQGFSHSGKRDPKDPRNSLFVHYVRFVDVLRPNHFVMENVPGMKSMRTASGEKAFDIILKAFQDVGYTVDWRILNACNYGVPQSRRRIFVYGNREPVIPTFPFPTNWGKEEGKRGEKVESKKEIGGVLVEQSAGPQTDLCCFS